MHNAMTTITLSSDPLIRDWESSTTTADRVVGGVTLTGTAAAAYHFGEALSTVQYQGLLDGVQLTDGRFEFPPASGQWVSLSELADALHYKYGVDPLIEFAPGLGLRGYSVADINAILERLNQEFKGQFSLALIDSAAVKSSTESTFTTEKAASPGSTATYNATAVASLLDTTSTAALASATEAELRQNLTEGGDLYVDRRGAFFINGVPTTAKDVAVVSRLLAQDNIAAEYKVLMDDYTERNNLIASARSVVEGGLDGLAQRTVSLATQYGMGDVLSELTSGQYSDSQITPTVKSTTATAITFANDPGWQTGTSVQAITAGVSKKYSVTQISDGTYEFHLLATNGSAASTPTNPSSLSGPFTRADVSAQAVSVGVDSSSSVGSGNYSRIKSTNVTWPTGATIRLKTDLLDFSNNILLHKNTDYYLRAESNQGYGVFDSLDHAKGTGDVGRQYVNSNITYRGLYEPDVITFPATANDPLLSDGAPIRIKSGSVTPLPTGVSADQDYYVRSLGGKRYNLFTTQAAAVAQGEPRPLSGLVALDGAVVAGVDVQPDTIDESAFDTISALLNTLISNKVRDGDLDQAKLQTLTAQLQNNTEAMTAMIKVFSDLNATLVQALR